ncbi:EAL domain-containing protein [bacterium]|nr:EAL domain-containing protein [bacterium]
MVSSSPVSSAPSLAIPPQTGNGPANMPWRMRDERDRFVAFAFASADILIELNPQGQVVFVDGATFSLLGIKQEQMTGRSFLEFITPDDRQHVMELLEKPRALKRLDRFKVQLTNQKTGKSAGFALSGYQIPYLNGHIFVTLGFIRRDIEATEIGMRDLSTGLYKQEAFAQKAAHMLKEATDKGHKLHVTLVELDDLPELLLNNEANEADILLEEICQYLQEQSYHGDATGMAGDNSFVILHDDSTTEDGIVDGIKSIYQQHQDKKAELRSGHIRLDAAHLNERDCARALQYTINKFADSHVDDFSITSLSESYQEMLAETVHRITDFHKTVEDGSFKIALQPIVDMRNRQPHHFEVLARLEENQTFANPFDFITFGEEAGVIGDFDLAMCQKTLDLLNAAARQGKRPMVSINLSGHSIGSNLFCDTLSQILRINNDVRHQVMFEITESSKIHDLSSANNFVQTLRKEGNLFCLDDFGVGESSFEYIRHLEVDYIKIDGSYVKDSLVTPRGKHLLRAMIGMCHDLQIATIAEMVEDENVAQFLSSCGVGFGQGYHFGKPTTDVTGVLSSIKNVPLPQPGKQTLGKASNPQRAWTDNLYSKN